VIDPAHDTDTGLRLKTGCHVDFRSDCMKDSNQRGVPNLPGITATRWAKPAFCWLNIWPSVGQIMLIVVKSISSAKGIMYC